MRLLAVDVVGLMRNLARTAVVASVVLSSSLAAAAGAEKMPWEEYDKLMDRRMSLASAGPDIFGDRVDLATGTLSFSVTDVSVTGSNSLPVEVRRVYTAADREDRGQATFGDWEIDIPRISGTFSLTWHPNRCDQEVPPSIVASGSSGVQTVDGTAYWRGTTADMPGGGRLLHIADGAPRPGTGGPYVWTTPGRAVFSCLPAIKNGPGQGYFAVDATGTKYWFDYMAQYDASAYTDVYIVQSGSAYDTNPPWTTASVTIGRKLNALYATRIEDRFGNSVSYSYSNAYNRPLRVDAISSSDGRSITFGYTNGVITSVAADGHRWSYGYTGGALTSVVLPDNSAWAMSLGQFNDARVEYANSNGTDPNWRTCFREGALDPYLSGPHTGTIVHPSGATGTFTVELKMHGRTNVPAVCRNWVSKNATNNYNDRTDDYAIFPIKWRSASLTSKTVAGPGLGAQTWTYSYASGSSYYYPDGQTEPYRCDTDTCAQPRCLNDACAGSGQATTVAGPDGWKRYTFGNSYRYNEGKLLSVEEGTDAANILRTTRYKYDYAQSGRPYAVRIGYTYNSFTDGFTSEYPRPEVGRDIIQNGMLFSSSVPLGCTAANAYCLDSFLRPVKTRKTASPIVP